MSAVEMAMKIDGRTLDPATLEQIRKKAIRRVREGETPAEVIGACGLCRATICRWMTASGGRGRGLRALASTCGTASRGTCNAAWGGSSDIRIEVVCDEATANAIADHLQARYCKYCSMMLFVAEVAVLRPERFRCRVQPKRPAAAVASSVLLLDEARKLAARGFARNPVSQPHRNTQGDQR